MTGAQFARIQSATGPVRVLVQGENFRHLDTSLGDPIWGEAPIVPFGDCAPLDGADLLLPIDGRAVYGMARNSGPADARLPPLVFQKPLSTLTASGTAIRLPDGIGRVFGEAEIAVIVGSELTHVTPVQAVAGIAGWTIANDVTGRDLQESDSLWFAAKGYDTFTPLGAVVSRGAPPEDARMRLLIDGLDVTNSTLRGLGRSAGECLSYLSTITTLRRGDILLTGAPGGGALLSPGSVVVGEADGLPSLINPVRRACGSAHT